MRSQNRPTFRHLAKVHTFRFITMVVAWLLIFCAFLYHPEWIQSLSTDSDTLDRDSFRSSARAVGFTPRNSPSRDRWHHLGSNHYLHCAVAAHSLGTISHLAAAEGGADRCRNRRVERFAILQTATCAFVGSASAIAWSSSFEKPSFSIPLSSCSLWEQSTATLARLTCRVKLSAFPVSPLA